GEVWVDVVDSELGAGQHDEPVLFECPFGLALDRPEVLGKPGGWDTEVRPQIVGRVHVIGDAEDVELIRAVEVDEGSERAPPVAQRGVRVELGEAQILTLSHGPHFSHSDATPCVEWVNVRPQSGEGRTNSAESQASVSRFASQPALPRTVPSSAP